LRFENHELLLQTLWIKAQEVIFLKMVFKSIIIDIILLLPVGRATITDVTSLVLISAMSIKLVISIESLTAKTTLRMSLETTLVDCTRLIISVSFMPSQFRWGE